MNKTNIKEDVLKRTSIEYFQAGKEEFAKKRDNSAVVLFFKCLVGLADLIVLREVGRSPSSHSDRFNITKKKLPEVYDLLDKDFPFYQDSYNIVMTKELMEVIENDARKLAEKAEIKL